MNAQSNAGKTPSIEEFTGYYNIPEEADLSYPVLQTVDQVPEYCFPEMWDVYLAAKKWFAEARPPLPKERFDPLAEDIFDPRDGANDRTLDIDAVDYRRLDVGFLQRIQREFLGRYPLWRIVLVGEDASTGILVYPHAIRFGNLSVDIDPEEALRDIVPRAIALREARQSSQRKQLGFYRERLVNAVRDIGAQPFYIFGVFDNYHGDPSRLTICVLIRGGDANAVELEGPPGVGNDFLSRSSDFGVDAHGEITSHISVPESSPFCLALWLPPADYRGPLTIIERDSGRRSTYELKTENISHSAEK